MENNLDVNRMDHVQGPENASIEFVEYGDYQCPYCGEAYYVIKKLQDRLGKDLKFVFRNFPLTNMHPYALNAAMAAECAGAQDKFWEMHDMLFENQRNLQYDDLLEYAQKLGLDMNKFRNDLGEKKYFDKINNDYQSGIEAGVGGTPTFFINGEKFNGNWTSPEFYEYVESLVGEKVGE